MAMPKPHYETPEEVKEGLEWLRQHPEIQEWTFTASQDTTDPIL